MWNLKALIIPDSEAQRGQDQSFIGPDVTKNKLLNADKSWLGSRGTTIHFRWVAALRGCIFQGKLLISEANFSWHSP